mmetsp:Transcript_49123/g.97624  ORF Transcript_49123/g.97624 Transcript_49123/m.97624 type:complete len:245 (-) Transcript_49123:81-815(-)
MIRPIDGRQQRLSAEDACCVCFPLAWGVRMISLLTMLVGFFAVVSVLSTPPVPPKEREREMREPALQDIVYIDKVWDCLKISGLVCGYQGFKGLYTRDSLKLKWLCCYYVLCFILEVFSLCFYIAKACQVLADLKPEIEQAAQHSHRRPLTCAEVQQMLLVKGFAQCAMYYFFAQAAWSLASHFSSNLPMAWGDPFSDMEAPLLAGYGVSEHRPQQQQQQQQQQQRERQQTKFQPFTGRPQRLD